MPRNPGSALSRVLAIMRQLEPHSILDVGCGWGEYGFLSRFHLEPAELWPRSFQERPRWTLRLDGIEIAPQNVGDLHRLYYDQVMVRDALEVADSLQPYDIILMTSLVEHLEKADAERLIAALLPKARQACIVATPLGFEAHEPTLDQEAQRHRSGWHPADFKKFGAGMVFVEALDQNWPYLICVLPRNPETAKRLKGMSSWPRRFVRHAISGALGPSMGSSVFLALRSLSARCRGETPRQLRWENRGGDASPTEGPATDPPSLPRGGTPKTEKRSDKGAE